MGKKQRYTKVDPEFLREVNSALGDDPTTRAALSTAMGHNDYEITKSINRGWCELHEHYALKGLLFSLLNGGKQPRALTKKEVQKLDELYERKEPKIG